MLGYILVILKGFLLMLTWILHLIGPHFLRFHNSSRLSKQTSIKFLLLTRIIFRLLLLKFIILWFSLCYLFLFISVNFCLLVLIFVLIIIYLFLDFIHRLTISLIYRFILCLIIAFIIFYFIITFIIQLSVDFISLILLIILFWSNLMSRRFVLNLMIFISFFCFIRLTLLYFL